MEPRSLRRGSLLGWCWSLSSEEEFRGAGCISLGSGHWLGGRASTGNIANQIKKLLLERSTKSEVKKQDWDDMGKRAEQTERASPLFPTPRLTLFI